MEIKIRKKYLIFPVNNTLKTKVLTLSECNNTVYSFMIKLDNYNPNFYAYIDVSRFIGKTLDISVAPEMKISYEESDYMDIPDLYNEPMRPQVHFTTKNGWLNDPNGLLYKDGIYHMFYQHNPAENHWGNMHWGHAVSKDLIHWEEKEIALFPGNNGDRFSGSGIIDKNNLLKLTDGNNPAAVLYYTATNPFSQCIAYSTDNFKTIKDYPGNPVVPNIIGANRDPKVTFCEELNTYIMALFLNDDEYGLLSSENLVDWKLFQKIKFNGENECPDIFATNDSTGQRKWVLMGARDKYIVGEFKSKKFVALQEVMSLHYGASAYAGQTFSNMPNNRVVRIVWNWWHNTSTKFNGQMGIPMELKLENTDGSYYLSASPIKEIESIYNKSEVFHNIKISENYRIFLDDKPYLLKFKGSYTNEAILMFEIFGCNFSVDFSKNQLTLGDKQSPVSINKDNFDITLLIDRCSIELFADGGKVYMASVKEYTVCDRNLPYLNISSNTEYNLENIELHSLDSIWRN